VNTAHKQSREESGHVADRRAVRRLPLHWHVSLKHATHVLSSQTENLSSRGFRCIVAEPLAAGDSFACVLRSPLRFDLPLTQALRCEASVIWASALGDGRFGIGCRIDDYAVIT